jgi:hypothetical protein
LHHLFGFFVFRNANDAETVRFLESRLRFVIVVVCCCAERRRRQSSAAARRRDSQPRNHYCVVVVVVDVCFAHNIGFVHQPSSSNEQLVRKSVDVALSSPTRAALPLLAWLVVRIAAFESDSISDWFFRNDNRFSFVQSARYELAMNRPTLALAGTVSFESRTNCRLRR